MISQKCPKCNSNRVRRGYRPTPFWSKIIFRYILLCDNCNWEFTGFAVPGTVSAKPTRNPKKKQINVSTELLDNSSNDAANVLPKHLGEDTISPENSTVAESASDDKSFNEIEIQSDNTSNIKAKRKSGV